MVRWRAIGTALRSAWPAWALLGGLVVAVGLGWPFAAAAAGWRWTSTTTLSAAVRYAGMLLQIFGLGTVAVGLSKTRELFGRPSIPARVKAWFGRIAAALRRPQPTTVQATAAEMFLDAESPTVVIGPAPNATLNDRVSILEQSLARLRDEADRHAQTIQQEIRQLGDKLAAKDQKLQSAVEANAKRIEESAIGGLHLEVVGLCWLFFGIIGTSIPGEAACWLVKVVAVVGFVGGP